MTRTCKGGGYVCARDEDERTCRCRGSVVNCREEGMRDRCGGYLFVSPVGLKGFVVVYNWECIFGALYRVGLLSG